MSITFELPEPLESELRNQLGDLSKVAREAFISESYRMGTLGTADVKHLLGVETRFEAEEWLASRGVAMNYSIDDLEDDRNTLNRLLGNDDR